MVFQGLLLELGQHLLLSFDAFHSESLPGQAVEGERMFGQAELAQVGQVTGAIRVRAVPLEFP